MILQQQQNDIFPHGFKSTNLAIYTMKAFINKTIHFKLKIEQQFIFLDALRFSKFKAIVGQRVGDIIMTKTKIVWLCQIAVRFQRNLRQLAVSEMATHPKKGPQSFVQPRTPFLWALTWFETESSQQMKKPFRRSQSEKKSKH